MGDDPMNGYGNVFGEDGRVGRAGRSSPDDTFSTPGNPLGEDDYRGRVHPDEAVMGEGTHRGHAYGT
ncbi:MAG: hypothetical protein ACXVX6_05345 [Mycobacterium sp.]